jgi:hypothetical protein
MFPNHGTVPKLKSIKAIKKRTLAYNFHIFTMHPAFIKVFYYQLMHKKIVFKGVCCTVQTQVLNSAAHTKDLITYMQPHHQINHNNVF